MTEQAFLKTILALAGLYSWRAIHIRPAWSQKGWRTPVQGPGSRGFPDLVLLKGSRMLMRELKTDKGALGPEQKDWLEALKEAGVDAGVWRPRDWPLIEEELSR